MTGSSKHNESVIPMDKRLRLKGREKIDAVDWTVVSGLTETSVAARSKPVDFPDFTRGLWKTRKPLGIIGEGEV